MLLLNIKEHPYARIYDQYEQFGGAFGHLFYNGELVTEHCIVTSNKTFPPNEWK